MSGIPTSSFNYTTSHRYNAIENSQKMTNKRKAEFDRGFLKLFIVIFNAFLIEINV